MRTGLRGDPFGCMLVMGNYYKGSNYVEGALSMTELIWDGKYDKDGKRVAPLRRSFAALWNCRDGE